MLKDRDGNIYTSVVIGALEVLVQNYRTTKYANGSPIPNLQSNTDLELFTAWSNIDFTTFTTSGSDITYAYRGAGPVGHCQSNYVTLNAGDNIIFDFNLTLIGGSLPIVIIYRNGVIFSSIIITAGVNNCMAAIESAGNYAIGFQADIVETEFSITGVSLGSDWNKAWVGDTGGAYCWYNNNIVNKATYGALYNHFSVHHSGYVYIERDGVVDTSWRVPTTADYQAISDTYGGDSVAGGPLKEVGLSHWSNPNTGATNASGFTGRPGGFRGSNGTFYFQNTYGNFWTSSEYSPTLHYTRELYYAGTAFSETNGYVDNFGQYVRLVRDYTGGGTSDPPTDPPEIGPGKILTVGYDAVEFFDRFNITYSIGDIRDLGYGSSDKSYTIELPLTKKNRHILKHINQVDVKSEPVNRARIYIDEMIIIQGKVFVLDYTDTHAKIMINSDDWIENLKSLKMSQLDLSAQDHQLTNTNVEATWSGADAFYRYPMIDFGALASGEIGLTANWSAVDFIPMIRIVDLITQILAPFTIISDFMALQYIKDLYILGREKIADVNFVEGKHLDIQQSVISDNTDTVSVAAETIGVAELASHKIQFNDEVTDEYPSWSAVNNEYTVPETGTYRFKATLILINSGTSDPFTSLAGNCAIQLMQAGSINTVLNTYNNISGVIDGLEVILDTGYVYLPAGDTIYININCFIRAYNNNTGAPENLIVGLNVGSKFELIWNNPTRYKGINDLIKLSEYMPDMSQADFLGAIRDVCDLRFWMDKSRQVVYIEPWDVMHTSGIRDISSLVDYASFSETPAEMISNNYNRSILMKWKDDNGDEAYSEHLRMYDSPLTKEIVLTSQFCKDGQEVKEHRWSTIVEGYNLTLIDYTKQVPRIWDHLITFSEIDFNRKVNFNTRIVHWDSNTACSQSWYFDSVEQTSYPKISGVSWGYIYSQFWQKIFHKIDKGKLYSVKMKVKPGLLTQFMTVIDDVDAENFRPLYKINIDGVDNYFRLQRITSDGEVAEIELILE
jgi:uncharacterized protein (TIGR02145 family)